MKALAILALIALTALPALAAEEKITLGSTTATFGADDLSEKVAEAVSAAYEKAKRHPCILAIIRDGHEPIVDLTIAVNNEAGSLTAEIGTKAENCK